jgi:hypothetical protein
MKTTVSTKHGLVLIVAVFLIWLLNGRWSIPLSASPLTFVSPLSPQTLTPRAYLPIVLKDYCSSKCWSGVHLGNKIDDWSSTLLQRIDPQRGGKWPAAVVVLSNQVYQINRAPRGPDPAQSCRVQSASVRTDRTVIFDYIQRAAQAGVKVIVRIYPSPGNFPDWNDPNWPNHRLSAGLPAGSDGYCDPGNYRSKADLADEMGEIHNRNIANNFSEFGFEPANEPNAEWYSTQIGSPRLYQVTVWSDMDAYFAAVYDWAHTYYPGVKVLTPPMSQGLYAESKNVSTCGVMSLFDGPGSGYDYMQNTYNLKNDGVDWHNYWIQGKEVYNFCESGGQHVSIYFPQWMQTAISNGQKAATISEADLASPQQNMGNPLTNKDSAASTAADSIRHFFDSEQGFGVSWYGVKAVTISWLLMDNTGHPEQDWHEAYTDTPSEREWYRLWYTGQESWP